MPKVFVTQPLLADSLGPLYRAGLTVEARTEPGPLPADRLRAAAAGADGVVCLLTDRIDAAFLDANPQVRVVANVAVGYDNIDVAAATDRGVAVANTPGVLTEATADLALALLLAAARRVPEGDTYLRAGAYRHWEIDQAQLGMEVSGQVLGILGLGQIGEAVARRARHGFGMQVQYHNARRLPAEREEALGVSYVTFDDLLATSDFVSIHAPLRPETRHLFNADAFARMKQTAILVNTARGQIVDEAALAAALRDGQIAGAGLDVYEHEPAVHPDLLDLREQVVLLPHLGSATRQTRQRMIALAIDAVVDVLAGRRPANLVNPECAAHLAAPA